MKSRFPKWFQKIVNYTNEDWVRIAHQNILESKERLEVLRRDTVCGERLDEKIGLTAAVVYNEHFLQDIDPEHPYQLTEQILGLRDELRQMGYQLMYMYNKVINKEKTEEYTIKDC